MKDYQSLSLKLNGEILNSEQLPERSKQKLSDYNTPEYENDIWSFINNWFNNEETLEIHTSGSTGTPKTIHIRKEYMMNSARMTCSFLGIQPEWNALLCLPARYIAGRMMIVRALISGCNLIVREPSGNPLEGMTDRIEFAAFVPLQIHNMLQNEAERNKLESISKVIIGGASIPQKVSKQLEAFSNGIYATYGMTETVSHIALSKISGTDHTEYFTPMNGVQVSLNERGCLILNAPHVGAHNLVTTDLAEIKSDQRFKILGRQDNVINSGGIKLFPEQIEAKLESIIPCRFIYSSLPDLKYGEKGILILEDIPREADKENTLLNKIRPLLKKYEIPKSIAYLPHFIETPTGKIDRRKTRQMLL
ncbi:MAG: AMP-binding protein [Bacteroidota bacterium]|nr:AMP-binding protein [Bacteroidota bacterium]MDP4206220.1 AMP-binding protein [Bacteroidota bacterium]